MPSLLDTAELSNSEDQTTFNLAVWQKVITDPLVSSLPRRIETDRFGQIIMSPPPAPEHGEEQFHIGKRLDQSSFLRLAPRKFGSATAMAA